MDELYLIARRVLLDALEAIGTHRGAVILVGAQAIYLRVGDADLAVAPYTTDGDLAIDPAALAEVPPLETALRNAGFAPKSSTSVGQWVTTRPTSVKPDAEILVDLLVPASISPGKGRRSAKLKGHDERVARIVRGLEGAVVDEDSMQLKSLEPNVDPRGFDIRVAGPAALLVAKLHKIVDRQGTDRLSDKDALDVLRLLRGCATADLGTRVKRMQADARSVEATRAALAALPGLFGIRTGAGSEMAARAAAPLADADEIKLACEVLTSDLIRALGI